MLCNANMNLSAYVQKWQANYSRDKGRVKKNYNLHPCRYICKRPFIWGRSNFFFSKLDRFSYYFMSHSKFVLLSLLLQLCYLGCNFLLQFKWLLSVIFHHFNIILFNYQRMLCSCSFIGLTHRTAGSSTFWFSTSVQRHTSQVGWIFYNCSSL